MASPPCGAYTHEIVDVSTGSELVPDSGVFTVDTASATKTLTTETSQVAHVKQYYTLRLKVYYVGYAAQGSYKDFYVEVKQYC